MNVIRQARSVLEGEFALVVGELGLLLCLRLPLHVVLWLQGEKVDIPYCS
jgi:hypothetical protein